MRDVFAFVAPIVLAAFYESGGDIPIDCTCLFSDDQVSPTPGTREQHLWPPPFSEVIRLAIYSFAGYQIPTYYI